jgi:hypothetical protein
VSVAAAWLTQLHAWKQVKMCPIAWVEHPNTHTYRRWRLQLDAMQQQHNDALAPTTPHSAAIWLMTESTMLEVMCEYGNVVTLTPMGTGAKRADRRQLRKANSAGHQSVIFV